MTAYDPNNIFAKILRAELPCHKVYENEHVLGFMDIMPRSTGHFLVLPKAPCRNLLDAPATALDATIRAVQILAIAARQAFDADGITVQQFNETAGGQEVFHLHFHIIPRFDGVALKPHTGEMADQNVLAEQAQNIRRFL